MLVLSFNVTKKMSIQQSDIHESYHDLFDELKDKMLLRAIEWKDIPTIRYALSHGAKGLFRIEHAWWTVEEKMEHITDLFYTASLEERRNVMRAMYIDIRDHYPFLINSATRRYLHVYVDVLWRKEVILALLSAQGRVGAHTPWKMLSDDVMRLLYARLTF
jgi:hypothetical protein